MKLSEAALLAAVTRDSFADFIKEFWQCVVPEKLDWNWHIGYIADAMQRGAERVFRGLPKEHDICVNVSPGTSKSSIVSVMFPVWTWTRMPTARHICTSYSHPLAMELSRKSRDLVKSELFRACFPHLKLRYDQDAKAHFQNYQGGFRYATGVGGSIMGYHAHFINIDDPIDPEQALSELSLKTASHYMREVLPTRKVSKAVTMTTLVMQRLAQDDPSAHFITRPNVLHICLPAELTDDVKPVEARKFYTDGLMDPVRLGRAVLVEAKNDLGPPAYAGQFLQTPVPAGGLLFDVDKVQVMNPPKLFLRLCRFWDKAGTAKGRGAFTAGVKIGLAADGTYWVLDAVRFRADSADRENRIMSLAARDGKKVLIGLEQEGAAGGKESAQQSVSRLAGYKVKLTKVGRAEGDKVTRAEGLSIQVNNGNLRIVPGPWNKDFLEEMRFFPHSRYKDQIDAAGGAFNLITVHRKRAGRFKRRDETHVMMV